MMCNRLDLFRLGMIKYKKKRLLDAYVKIVFILSFLTPLVGYTEAKTPSSDPILAVLDFRDEAQLPPFERALLADSVRGVALDRPFQVMTKENMMTLLPPGRTLEDCIGECEVEVGRLIGADYIITGMIGRLEGEYRLLIRVYETQTGHLKGQAQISAPLISQLQSKVSRSALQLLETLSPRKTFFKEDERTLLFIQLKPKYAQVKLDGYPLDLSKGKRIKGGVLIPVSPGKHTISARAKGYLPKSTRFRIVENQPNQVDLKLNKRYATRECGRRTCFGKLFVYTQPAGALVYLNGKSTGKRTRPLANQSNKGSLVLSLPEGQYWVSARKKPYQDAQRLVKIKEDRVHTSLRQHPLVLKSAYGSISLTSSPSGAIVRLNGEVVGKTPFSKKRLPLKPYWVELLAEGFQNKERLITFKRSTKWTDHWDLASSTAEVVITVEYQGRPVADVAVWIDGEHKGSTDSRGQVKLTQIAGGDHDVQLRHPLYTPLPFNLRVKGGQKLRKRASLKGAFARLSIEVSQGQQGQVFWAGRDLGQAPLNEVLVPAGRHWLQIRPQKEDIFEPYRTKLNLLVGQHQTIKAEFLPYRALLHVETRPSRATVFIDGKKVGRTPFRGWTRTGKHTLKIQQTDMNDYVKEVEIPRKGWHEKVDFYSRTSLEVECGPHQGLILLNGKEIGGAPQIMEVKPGTHQVRCTLWGLEREKTFTLSQGQQLNHLFQFSPSDLVYAQKRSQRFRFWGQVLVASSVLGLGIGSGLWAFPYQETMAQRDQASQKWINQLNQTQRDQAYRQWAEADNQAKFYHQASIWTWTTSAILGIIGGGLWYFTPQVPTYDQDLRVPLETESTLKSLSY